MGTLLVPTLALPLARARWLLAPVYLGLSLALIALTVVFFREVWHLFEVVFGSGLEEADAVLIVLSLIDISLVGGLLVGTFFTLFVVPTLYQQLRRWKPIHRLETAPA